MPRFEHVVETVYKPTFRTEKVAGMFDVPVSQKLKKTWHVDIPIENREWSVGLIVGASGSGKTTIAKKAFGDECYFSGHVWERQCFLDDFPESLEIKKITDALSSVGFSSPPSWLLPYSVLSNGQQFRADLARALLETESILVFDEFTSVVDRTVAKIGAFAAQKFVRRYDRQLVAVTCHYDVVEWLEPDWVYDVSTSEFKWGRLRRPDIEINIERCHYSAWRLFQGHHYLSADINKAAKIYVAFLLGQPAGLCAILPFPHPRLKNAYRGHRTVVLPDYQGIGLGNRLSEAIGDMLIEEGKKFISTTTHPAMIAHRTKSPKWKLTRKPSRVNKPSSAAMKQTAASFSRLTCSFRYVGQVDSA